MNDGSETFNLSQSGASQVDLAPGSSYRLAYQDVDFLRHDALRGVRMGLELTKVEMALQDHEIRSTVALFGGARVRPATAFAERKAQPQVFSKTAACEELFDLAPYYEEARRFAYLCSQYAQQYDYKEFVVATGGGPGVMEAGNLGAKEAGAPSIGLNIILPHEQSANPYVSPELCFRFQYFAMRKVHFLLRAKAVAVFPGGFGTLDELSETLTLMQTGRMAAIPVLLFGEQFFQRVLNIDYLYQMGMIAEPDRRAFTYVNTAEEAFAHLKSFYQTAE